MDVGNLLFEEVEDEEDKDDKEKKPQFKRVVPSNEAEAKEIEDGNLIVFCAVYKNITSRFVL